MTGVIFALGLVLTAFAVHHVFFGADRPQSQLVCALPAAYDLNYKCAYGRVLVNRYASLLVKALDGLSTAGVTPWMPGLLGLRA